MYHPASFDRLSFPIAVFHNQLTEPWTSTSLNAIAFVPNGCVPSFGGVPNARRKPYTLSTTYTGKLFLLFCVTIQPQNQGHHRKVSSHFSPMIDPYHNLSMEFSLSYSSEWLARMFLLSGLWPLLQSLYRCLPHLLSLTDISFIRGFFMVKTELLVFWQLPLKAQKTPAPPNLPVAILTHHWQAPTSRHDPKDVAASPIARVLGTPISPWQNSNP